MSHATEAQQIASKLGAWLEHFTRAKAVIDAAVIVEQQTADAERRRDTAVRAADDAEAALVPARERLQDVRLECERLHAATGKVVAEAQQRAADELKTAQAQARDLVAAAHAEVEAKRKEAGDVIARQRAAERELGNLEKQIDAAKARLEQVKEQARQAFGG